MLDIGWPELVVILVVALIVIGPKDLPRVLHTVGKWVRKARALSREFQNSIDDMVREADLEDVRKQAQQLRQMNLKNELEKTIDPTGALKNAFDPSAPSSSQPTSAKPVGTGRPDDVPSETASGDGPLPPEGATADRTAKAIGAAPPGGMDPDHRSDPPVPDDAQAATGKRA